MSKELEHLIFLFCVFCSYGMLVMPFSQREQNERGWDKSPGVLW